MALGDFEFKDGDGERGKDGSNGYGYDATHAPQFGVNGMMRNLANIYIYRNEWGTWDRFETRWGWKDCPCFTLPPGPESWIWHSVVSGSVPYN